MILLSTALATTWTVDSDAALRAAEAGAVEGDVIELTEGRYTGPLHLRAAVTLNGPGTLVSNGGKTLVVDAPGTVVRGVRIEGSGDDLRGPDACLYVGPAATGAVIADNTLTDCLFGIWTHEVSHVRLVGNHVTGREGVRNASKGNGIHLFDSADLLVENNTVEHARDGIYVSATENSRIVGNQVSNQRFGIHYMYSYDNEIVGNVANDNSGGIALMQSMRLRVSDNETSGNSRHGILFRDVLDSTITGNVARQNTEGFYFFSSVRNEIVGNTLANNQIGARVWAGTVDNDVRGNAFVANRQQIFYVASSDQHWGPNHWSDYLGWDQDGNGHGDRPYRNDAFLARLLHTYPAAVLLLSSPSLELLAQLQGRMPALRVPTVIDETPLMSRP